ncbi:MAG TPA: LytR C-terminal domain-containing protein, partial [Nocardioidaceae bacterium]|nr:LytR C-terminal domain-containing protein [Nocardioidaceae bacterium]
MFGALRGRRYDERGIALSSPVAMLSLAAVVLAGVAFAVTGTGTDTAADAARPVTATLSVTPSPTPSPPATKDAKDAKDAKPKRKQQPAARRGDVFVEVYNNSGISGLAGSTAERISGAGWQVVGSDNWYGTIPASTV